MGLFDWLKVSVSGHRRVTNGFSIFLDLYQQKIALAKEVSFEFGKTTVVYDDNSKRLLRALFVLNSNITRKLGLIYKQESKETNKFNQDFTAAIMQGYHSSVSERSNLQKGVLDEKMRISMQQFSDFSQLILTEIQKQNQNRNRARQQIENPTLRYQLVQSLNTELLAFKSVRILLVRFLKIMRDAKVDDEKMKELEALKDNPVRLEPLTNKTLSAATALVREVFPLQGTDEPARYCFRASLNPAEYADFLNKCHVVDLKYWLLIDSRNKVIGTTGLYSYADDQKDSSWLGWMCVSPSMRGRGLSRVMMDAMIAKAKAAGKRYLKLYTSNSPNEASAQFVYEKYGLKIATREPIHGSPYDYLFRQVRL